MFKLGDWVRYIKGKTKTIARVEILNQRFNLIGVSTGENVHIDDCEIWQPKEGEWVWVYDKEKKMAYSPFIWKYTGAPLNEEFDIETDNIEPFIGELPTFLKD